MRPPVDAKRIHDLADRLDRVARSRVRVYVTGGATAVLEGWRDSTIDVDLRFEPEADELMRALVEIKESLGINIEFASPPDFIPELPGWRDRSKFEFTAGKIDVYSFDPYSQALSKIERGFEQDLSDVREMLDRGLVLPHRVVELFEEIEPMLYRYPAIEATVFRQKVLKSVGRA